MVCGSHGDRRQDRRCYRYKTRSGWMTQAAAVEILWRLFTEEIGDVYYIHEWE